MLGRKGGAEEAGPLEETVARKPPWLKARLGLAERAGEVHRTLDGLGLRTVCRDALCPNRARCFSRGTATFMILGETCTRACPFCAVPGGIPPAPDPEEPRRVAEAARRLGLSHVVVTSVARDDLPDGGASHFAATVSALRALRPSATVEVLVPDFGGDAEALAAVLAAGPDVLNHNLETVPRLYPRVRPAAAYGRSLEVLARARSLRPGVTTKSGLMLGLGEREEEVLEVLRDLRRAGCDLVTLGQYLQPSRCHLPVAEYLPPGRFAAYRRAALDLGFRGAVAGPLVRSSYHAGDLFHHLGSAAVRRRQDSPAPPPNSRA